MSELNASIDHFYCFVRKEYLYAHTKGHGEYMDAVVFGVTSEPGRATTFSALLEDGAQFIHLPVSALCWKPTEPLTLGTLQLWDNFGPMITVTKYDYLSGIRVEAFLKMATGLVPSSGDYCMTFDWYDNGFSEQPDQHKTGHLIKLDDGNYCIQPNNRLRWRDASFVTPFKEKPDYRANNLIYSAERNRLTAEDKYFY